MTIRHGGDPGESGYAGEPDVASLNKTEETRNSPYVTAFGRGLSVIRCFSANSSSLTIAEVARLSGLNRATARRFLYTLEAHEYVGNAGGKFFLRPRVLELGYAYLSSLEIGEVFQQALQELAETLNETCSAGVLDGHDVAIVARAQPAEPRVLSLAFSIGARFPAYLTSVGRVLLAELTDEELEKYLSSVQLRRETEHTIAEREDLHHEILKVRAAGYCTLDQEIELGLRAIAVPLRREGKPTMAVGTAAHASRVSMTELHDKILPALKSTASSIEDLLRLRH
ncbi:MAG: IclR family transcriptional regulator C-terminal domain-containing protein [Acidimicrobiales bacterium]